jgi:hypothetical protein
LVTSPSQLTRSDAYLPSLRRWTRVRRSSLRCFFFDMRLRRFLITEPIGLSSRSLYSARTLPVRDCRTSVRPGPGRGPGSLGKLTPRVRAAGYHEATNSDATGGRTRTEDLSYRHAPLVSKPPHPASK